jgi:hypothetical protein
LSSCSTAAYTANTPAPSCAAWYGAADAAVDWVSFVYCPLLLQCVAQSLASCAEATVASVLQQDANRWDISPRSLYYCSYGVRREGGMLAAWCSMGSLPLLNAVMFARCSRLTGNAAACRTLAQVIRCVQCPAMFPVQHVFHVQCTAICVRS